MSKTDTNDEINKKIEEAQKILKEAKELSKKYEKLVIDIERNISKKADILSKIPKLVFPYQRMVRELYIAYDDLSIMMEEEIRNQTIAFKLKRHKFSGLTLSATEQKSLIEKSTNISSIKRLMKNIERQAKFFETSISTLRAYPSNISTLVEYRKLIGG